MTSLLSSTSFSGRLYGLRSHKQKEIAERIEEVCTPLEV